MCTNYFTPVKPCQLLQTTFSSTQRVQFTYFQENIQIRKLINICTNICCLNIDNKFFVQVFLVHKIVIKKLHINQYQWEFNLSHQVNFLHRLSCLPYILLYYHLKTGILCFQLPTNESTCGIMTPQSQTHPALSIIPSPTGRVAECMYD